jgi:hypothetical protein
MNDNDRKKARVKRSTERAKLEQAVIDALYLGLTDPDRACSEDDKCKDGRTFVVEILVDDKGKYSVRVREEDKVKEKPTPAIGRNE